MGGPESGLGERGRKVLRLISRREVRGEEGPSVREMARAAGYASSRGGQRVVEALEAAGYAERGLARKTNDRRPVRLTEKGWAALGEVPDLGRIAAGRGMEPVRRVGEVVPLGGFALDAHGDSMVGAGIRDGDKMLFAPDPSPPDGSVVAALLLLGGEQSVTVKRLFRENGSVRLRAENAAYGDMVVPADEVEIQGRLEWILKRPSRGEEGRR